MNTENYELEHLAKKLKKFISKKKPSSKSILKIIKDRYGESVLKLVPKFERTDLRCRKVELDLSFLKYCF